MTTLGIPCPNCNNPISMTIAISTHEIWCYNCGLDYGSPKIQQALINKNVVENRMKDYKKGKLIEVFGGQHFKENKVE